jgi:hypothetical protein
VKVKFLDFRDAGCTSIRCDCSDAEFFITEEAIKHVEDYHMTDEQFDDPALARDVISRMLSPNPIPNQENYNAKK